MTGVYRTVYFLPDPAIDWRIPVAVVLDDREGVRVGVASRLPDDACLGGRASAALLHLGLGCLRTMEGLQTLPSSLGPHFVAEPAKELHVEADDPLAWAIENLLPSLQGAAHRRSRGAQRATIGYKFFVRAGVDRYVRKRFRPDVNVRNMNGVTRSLFPVSHWVPGRERLLLLEPLIPTRADAENEAKNVVVSFLAYRQSFVERLQKEHSLRAELIVYLGGQGNGPQRRALRDRVREAADSVFDVLQGDEREALAGRVREVGETAPAQSSLFRYDDPPIA